VFGEKNVSGVAAIHHSLRHVKASAREIGPFVYIVSAEEIEKFSWQSSSGSKRVFASSSLK
jgi:hypothetical protein